MSPAEWSPEAHRRLDGVLSFRPGLRSSTVLESAGYLHGGDLAASWPSQCQYVYLSVLAGKFASFIAGSDWLLARNVVAAIRRYNGMLIASVHSGLYWFFIPYRVLWVKATVRFATVRFAIVTWFMAISSMKIASLNRSSWTMSRKNSPVIEVSRWTLHLCDNINDKERKLIF